MPILASGAPSQTSNTPAHGKRDTPRANRSVAGAESASTVSFASPLVVSIVLPIAQFEADDAVSHQHVRTIEGDEVIASPTLTRMAKRDGLRDPAHGKSWLHAARLTARSWTPPNTWSVA